jgi:hypothetical protein
MAGGAQVPAPAQAAQEADDDQASPQRVADASPRGRYDAGRFASPTEKIASLLFNEDVASDLLVELLPAMLWLEKATGMPTNLCASSCITLHFAYAELGIPAQPRAVDLVVANQRTGKRTTYGQSDPHWVESTFHGHCILWLPETRRILDPTVEQYPEVRHYRLGPICGRIVAGMTSNREQQAQLARGQLPAGTGIGVKREDLLLLYTAVAAEYDDIVLSASLLRDDLDEVQRSARNLAAWTLDQLRRPNVIDRARRAPYPRVRTLLDLLARAEAHYDEDHLRFVLPDDPSHIPRRLDELQQLARPPRNKLLDRSGQQLAPGPREALSAELRDLPDLTVVNAAEPPSQPPPRRRLLRPPSSSLSDL